MSTYFQDKVIWITGASSGIGEALSYTLAGEASRLVLSSRKREDLERVAAKTGLSPERILILPLDLMDYRQMPEKARQVIDHFGQIDILINNAGISQRGSVSETDITVDEKIMTVNFLGTAGLTKAVLPYMKKARSGQIISVASVAGEVATPRRSSYAAAKSALIRYMDALRAEVYDQGIQVGVFLPGYVRTNISINALTADGSPQGTMDDRTDNGLSPEYCARKMVQAIRQRKDQTFIAGRLEMLAIYVKRIYPPLLRRMIRNIAAT